MLNENTVRTNGPRSEKTCLREFSEKSRFKPVSLATETTLKVEISRVASLDMILSISE